MINICSNALVALVYVWMLCSLPVSVMAQEGTVGVLTLNGEGPAETQLTMLRV